MVSSSSSSSSWFSHTAMPLLFLDVLTLMTTTMTTEAFVRPVGIYLLAGTAMHSQTKSAFHLTTMEGLASEALVFSTAADADVGSSMVLQGESATHSEEGLLLQSEAAELEVDAEREYLVGAAEHAMGDEYKAKAMEMQTSSEQEALESKAFLAQADEMTVEAGGVHAKAVTEGETSAVDLETSVADAERSVHAIQVATAAEEQAIEYGAVVTRDVVKTARDGETLIKTETGAMEDAEVMAACAPIPLLNAVCEAIGSVVEVGYQSVAAVEGVKAAVDSIAAATARGRERAELLLATEKREEAGRLAFEAERLQVQANEMSAQAVADERRAVDIDIEAEEANVLGEERWRESEREGVLATAFEEEATDQYAKATHDVSIAVEEESSAIATEVDAEELLSTSTKEEFESLAQRTDAISNDAKAEGLVKQSLGYGMRALAYVMHSIMTAGLVVYVLVLKGVTKSILPGVGRALKGEHQLSVVHVQERICDFLMHIGVAVGTIASLPELLLNFETSSAPMRIRALFQVAVIAGVIESVVNGVVAARSTIAKTSLGLLSNLVHSVPVYILELCIVVALVGPGVFDETQLVQMNSVLIWSSLFLLKCISVCGIRLCADSTKRKQDVDHIDDGECDFLRASDGHPKAICSTVSPVDKEYGSLEEMSLLFVSEKDTICRDEMMHISSNGTLTARTSTPANCLERCRHALFNYFDGLRLFSDLLVLSLMVAILRHCWPLLKVLYPVAATLLGVVTAWASLPILICVMMMLVVIVHVLFVR